MIFLLAAAALADPPRGEVTAGWSGNATQGYGFVAAQPALARNEEASFVLRASVSQLYYTFDNLGVETRVDSPGASIGPGFVYAPGDVSLGAAVAFEIRRPTEKPVDGPETTDTELGATLATNLYWRPGHRSALYGILSFSGANEYLWSRAGFMQQVIPMFRTDTAAALWIGPDITTSGNEDTRLLEFGGTLEVPVRKINMSFNVRGGYALQDVEGANPTGVPSIGAGLYWAY